MSSEHRKSSFSTGRNRSGSINTPRFDPRDVHRGHSSTAEHHTRSNPDIISLQNSADEMDSSMPGAYPQDDMPWVNQMLAKHHEDNPKHLGTMKVDLPLEEQPSGAREGVGSLPGPTAESGVALLPDERHPDRVPEQTDDSPLPSKEHPSGSRVGVGSLPGKNFEAGVATLPEERIDGRPFGQSHTGFEKTLGNERVHVDVDTPATHTKGKHAPKETIFTATQREMKQDPNFLAHRGAFFQNPPSTEGMRTFVQGAAGAMFEGTEALLQGAQGAIQSFEERFKGQDPIQATKDMIQRLEARFGAEDAINRAKEQIQNLENRIEVGAGDAVQGAKDVVHNLEARFVPGYSAPNTEASEPNITSRDYESQSPAGGSSGKQSGHPTGMFVTTGRDAPHSKSRPPSRGPIPQTSTSKKDFHRVSGVPSSLPLSLQREYLKKKYHGLAEYDLDGERYDMNMFIYDDDESTSIPSDLSTNGGEADRASPLGGGHRPPSIQPGDMARGANSVQFNTKAQGDILPGYPTQEGMAKLISDRMTDDRARAVAAGNASNTSSPIESPSTKSGRARFLRENSYASVEAVRGSYSSAVISSSNSGSPDPTVDDRIIEERREIPIFEGGSIHADGKYEATFRPVSDYPEELIASSTLHHAARHHESRRVSRSEEKKDLSGQFTHRRKHSAASPDEDRARHEQLVKTDHPNELEERPDFRGQSGDTAFGKYEATFHPAGGPPRPFVADEEQLRREQVVRTNHPNEVDERPDFIGQMGDTAAGKYEATYHPAGMPSSDLPSFDMPTTNNPSVASRSLDTDAERSRNEQVMKTDHPNEIDERPDFRGQSGDTAFGKYEATFHPAGMPARPFVADEQELRREQVAKTNHPNEIEERPDFVGQMGDTAAGKYEATYHPAGAPSAGSGDRISSAPAPVPSAAKISMKPTDSRFQDEQLATTDHPNEIEERPDFIGQVGDTAAGKYEATYHPAGMPSASGTESPSQQPRRHQPSAAKRPKQTRARFGSEQLVSTNHPNEIDERPTFVNHASDTAAGKYEATFHLAGMGPEKVPVSHSRRHPAPEQEQVAVTNHPNEVEEKPVFMGGGEAASGQYEAVYSLKGVPLNTSQTQPQKQDIVGTGMEQGQTAVKKELPGYLGKPLPGKQPVQAEEPRHRKKKGIN